VVRKGLLDSKVTVVWTESQYHWIVKRLHWKWLEVFVGRCSMLRYELQLNIETIAVEMATEVFTE